MTSFADIIDALGGPTAAMQALGAPTPQSVWNMKARNSIPPRYWPRLVAVAEERGLPGITFESLAQIVARPSAQLPETAAGIVPAAAPPGAEAAA